MPLCRPSHETTHLQLIISYVALLSLCVDCLVATKRLKVAIYIRVVRLQWRPLRSRILIVTFFQPHLWTNIRTRSAIGASRWRPAHWTVSNAQTIECSILPLREFLMLKCSSWIFFLFIFHLSIRDLLKLEHESLFLDYFLHLPVEFQSFDWAIALGYGALSPSASDR